MADGAGRRSAREWSEVVRAWKRSGLSAASFAATAGCAPRTLEWWSWKLRQRARERQDRGPGVGLVPVEVVEQSSSAAAAAIAWELVTPAGLALRVYEGAGADIVRAVVEAMVDRDEER